MTADDDILYPENHLEKLWKTHLEFPQDVICQWSHRIAFDEQGEFLPYNDWPDNGREAPSLATLAVGCSGILYPLGAVVKEAFDQEKLQKYALAVDDLWLKCMELLAGTKTVNCNQTILVYYNILSTRKSGLWVSNTDSRRIMIRYGNCLWSSTRRHFSAFRKKQSRSDSCLVLYLSCI